MKPFAFQLSNLLLINREWGNNYYSMEANLVLQENGELMLLHAHSKITGIIFFKLINFLERFVFK